MAFEYYNARFVDSDAVRSSVEQVDEVASDPVWAMSQPQHVRIRIKS